MVGEFGSLCPPSAQRRQGHWQNPTVAIAVQRGTVTAVSYLHGYEKALRTLRRGKSDTAVRTA